jgi:hypothetical protein
VRSSATSTIVSISALFSGFPLTFVAALDAQKRLGVAMIGGDFKAVEMMFANDLVDGVWKLTIRQATVTSVQ